MMLVEFIYDDDCQNVGPAREQLRNAMSNLGLSREWKEWDRADPKSPDYAQGDGSPTILINGKDVAGVDPGADASCCRVYKWPDGKLRGIPTVEMIESALKEMNEKLDLHSCCGS